MVCATSKASDQPAHTRSLIRASASRLSIYDCQATDQTPFGVSKLKMRPQRLARIYTCQNVKLLEISCTGSIILFNIRLTSVCLKTLPSHAAQQGALCDVSIGSALFSVTEIRFKTVNS